MDNSHLQPGFDPSSVRMSDLRGILLQHDVDFPTAAKKADLVAIYEAKVRPHAAKWLAKREKVRASSRGIEDVRAGGAASGSAAGSSRRGNVAPPTLNDILESLRRATSPEPARSARTGSSNGASSRKSVSMNNLAAAATSSAAPKKRKSSAGTAPSRSGMRRSASVELSNMSEAEEEEERAAEGDADATPAKAIKRSSSRPSLSSKSARAPNFTAPPTGNEPVPMEIDEDNELAQPPSPDKAGRRKSAMSPSKPVVEVPMRRKSSSEMSDAASKRKHSSEGIPILQEEAKVESGFSDYNPFQSGGEESPDGEKKKKRRKSSLAPSANPFDDVEQGGGGMRRSATMQALGGNRNNDDDGDKKGIFTPSSARKSASKTGRRESAAPPVPAVPSVYAGTSTPSKGLSTSKSMPSFAKASGTPLQSLQTRPEDFTLSSIAKPERQASRGSIEETTSARQRQSPTESTARRTRSSEMTQLTRDDQELLDELAEEPLMQGRETDDDEDTITVRATSDSIFPSKPASPKKSPKRGPPPPERRVAEAAKEVVPASQAQPLVVKSSQTSVSRPVRLAITTLPLLAALGSYGNYWAAQKQQLGFCDTDATANRAVIHRRMQHVTGPKAYTSNPAINEFLKDASVYLTPDTCEPCPAHAACEDGQVKSCVRDYILQPNAIAFLVSNGLDPKDSVAPLLFKPYCRPDTERLVRVAETATQISTFLRGYKGEIICSGEEKARRKTAKKGRDGTPEEWAVYGASQDWLRKVIAEKKSARIPESQFDDIFEEAILDLISHNEIVHGVDHEAEPWIAAVAADLPLACRTRLAAYNAAAEHKTPLAGLAAALLAALYGRLKLAQKRAIDEQVDELVPIALQLLQAQEQNYHIDNVLNPTPYLAPAQLRDLVLAHEHSPSRRAELWKRVEKIVEGNSNVRAKVAEQHGEDMRVWQWVGGAYGLLEDDLDPSSPADGSAVRRRKSYSGLAPRPSLSRPGTPRIGTPGRHITWSKDTKGQESPL